MQWYEYIVRWFDAYDKGDEVINHGITYAEDIVQAMDNISGYYGRNEIFTVKIHELDDCSCFDFEDYAEQNTEHRLFESIIAQTKSWI